MSQFIHFNVLKLWFFSNNLEREHREVSAPTTGTKLCSALVVILLILMTALRLSGICAISRSLFAPNISTY